MSALIGTHRAKIVNYGVAVSKGGHPQVAVDFEWKTPYDTTHMGGDKGLNTHKLTWFGSLHPNAAQYTIETLILLGLKNDDLTQLVDGPGTQALNLAKEFEIVVAEDFYDGKTYTKIKYINEIGGNKWRGMEPIQAKTSLSSLTGLVSQVRQYGATREKKTPSDALGTVNGDVPF